MALEELVVDHFQDSCDPRNFRFCFLDSCPIVSQTIVVGDLSYRPPQVVCSLSPLLNEDASCASTLGRVNLSLSLSNGVRLRSSSFLNLQKPILKVSVEMDHSRNSGIMYHDQAITQIKGRRVIFSLPERFDDYCMAI